MRLEDIIIKPLITEKATKRKELVNEYFFIVDPKARKHEIRTAVEMFFQVKVETVRTMNTHGKKKRVGKYFGRTPDWKKAIVTLKKGETIKMFEGA